jgi:hypothetical protein
MAPSDVVHIAKDISTAIDDETSYGPRKRSIDTGNNFDETQEIDLDNAGIRHSEDTFADSDCHFS